MENLISQLEESEDLPMCELLGLDMLKCSGAFEVHSRWKWQGRLSYSNVSSKKSKGYHATQA